MIKDGHNKEQYISKVHIALSTCLFC